MVFQNLYGPINSYTAIAPTRHIPGLWLGTNKGLFTYHTETDSFHSILPQQALLQTRITAIQPINENQVLIGTKKAGLLLNDLDREVPSLSVIPELAQTPIQEIMYEASLGYLWVRTPLGIYRFDTTNLSKSPLFIAYHSITQDKLLKIVPSSDYLFLLSPHRLTRFSTPDDSTHTSLPPHIVLAQAGDIQLSSSKNNELTSSAVIRFKFTVFDYKLTPHITYRYRLQATDEWLKTQNRELWLSNLSPGPYQFEVQAQLAPLDWSPSTTLSFHILPPFWQRWWFWFLVILFLGSVVALIVRARFQELKATQQQQDLQLQLERIQQQAYQAQMNPHFIFNSLNAIQGFILGTEEEQQQAVSYLAKFSLLVRKALNYASKVEIPLAEDIEMIKEYLALEKMRFGSSFTYSVTTEEVEPGLVHIPPMLVQPLVENAVLHGLPRDQTGKIKVHYAREGNQLVVTISDNGPGYTKAQQKRHSYRQTPPKGLRITQERLQLLGNSQSPATLQIREDQDKQGKVLGTTVILRLPVVH
jgi:signal transduction histidine kinase